VIITPGRPATAPRFNISNPLDGTTVSLGYGPENISTSCHYITEFGNCLNSLGVTITNSIGYPVILSILGDINDDVIFDGVVYQDGQFCYFAPGCAWESRFCFQGIGSQSNGAHSFNYSQVLPPGQSLLIQGQDNGFGGGIDCTITVSF
jgi:hypothetical protein